MNKKQNVFHNDVEVPEFVQKKADEALSVIRMKGRSTTVQTADKVYRKRNRRYLHFFRSQAAAAACIAVIAGSGITAAAAGYHLWSRGMQGTVQATPQEQQELIDKGVAVTGESTTAEKNEKESLSNLAVTDAGITIIPDSVIVDDWYAHISFSVQGYDLPEGEEPFFETTNVTQDSGKDLAMNAGFYDGTTVDENGQAVNEDGSALEKDADGNILMHYTDENGNMEYVVTIYQSDPGDSLVGKKIHVDLSNLGTVDKTDFSPVKDGEWDFAISLPDVSAGKTLKVGKRVKNTNFILDAFTISPISIRMNFSVTGDESADEYGGAIPSFRGVVLKDGMTIPFLAGGGPSGGYTDDAHTSAYSSTQFAQIIDPDEVASVLVNLTKTAGTEYAEIPVKD